MIRGLVCPFSSKDLLRSILEKDSQNPRHTWGLVSSPKHLYPGIQRRDGASKTHVDLLLRRLPSNYVCRFVIGVLVQARIQEPYSLMLRNMLLVGLGKDAPGTLFGLSQ